MIIGISGRIGSGKDTVANMIRELTKTPRPLYEHGGPDPRLDGWQIKKFAGPLKQCASILLGVPEANFESQEFKATHLGPEYDRMTVREFLQKLGTDAVRDGLHKQTWVNALFSTYRNNVDKWLISDMRFKNEFDAVKERGGITLRIERGSYGKSKVLHQSENALDSEDFDYTIHNTSDIDALRSSVKMFLKMINAL